MNGAEMSLNRVYARAFGSQRYRTPYRNIALLAVLLLAVYGLYYSWKWDMPSLFPDDQNQTIRVPSHERARRVKQAFLHAYHGYERYAAPSDELLPLTNDKINNFNGWGLTIFDSLDTMLLMGLQEEFDRALPFVEQANFSISENVYAPYFETVIRYLGGLLSAYALSKNPMLLRRADELASKLDPIFNTPIGMPLFSVNPTTGETRGPEIGILAEIASLQMEYSYLAKLTGKKEYFERADAVIKTLANARLDETGGMFPIGWNLTSGQPADYRLSMGAQADSAHEYLLKHHLLTGKTDKASLEMYIRMTTFMITNLLYVSPNRHLLYVTDTGNVPMQKGKARPTRIFEHLSCFLPGLLALGAHTLPLDRLQEELNIHLLALGNTSSFGKAGYGYEVLAKYDLKQLHLWAAEGLAQTCWLTYADQPTGLGPDEIVFTAGENQKIWDGTRWKNEFEVYPWIESVEKWRRSGSRGPAPGVADKLPVVYSQEERLSGKPRGRDYALFKSQYLLRPETVESLYILWRTTGNKKWRDRGWSIFEAIERHTKTASGYASLLSVDSLMPKAPKENSMPSYFLAETLKYLYLLFLDEDPLPLDKWVFNTEAHPFPIFEWTEKEREMFRIDY
ncbi:glycoside hydrolase family 47 protein [Cyathus striatus]|nr:glycoside hydrolase family 47 protein [Cyathus striatus]